MSERRSHLLPKGHVFWAKRAPRDSEKRERRSLLLRSVLAISTLALVTATVSAQTSGFTPDERALLLAGELVSRDMSRREGDDHLFGGSSWQRVHAPIDRVWQTVTDPSAYPRLIPSLERVRVVEAREHERVLLMHHSYAIASTDYYAIMRIDDAHHRIEFELDRSRPHDVRSGRGFVSLSPYHGDTIVAWGMLADVGAGMLQQVFGPFLNQWLLLPPRCVRDEVELGRQPSC